jgi:hypothetical protein
LWVARTGVVLLVESGGDSSGSGWVGSVAGRVRPQCTRSPIGREVS